MISEDMMFRKYVKSKLYNAPELKPYLEEASIVRTENDPGLVWDIMVFLPDELFQRFSAQYGESFAIDDNDHVPPVFIRVKSFSWLSRDFAWRLPIALWIYQHSLVFQDKTGSFNRVLQEQSQKFSEKVSEMLKRKYLEFRTERHNLRHALRKNADISITLIKATVVKLSLEICFLVEGKPYPYKKWLSRTALTSTVNGKKILKISESFLREEEPEAIIRLSDDLLNQVAIKLYETRMFSEDFLHKWWFHLL